MDSTADPFKTVRVDPVQIHRFSGRPDLHHHRRHRFGEIRSGNWDRGLDEELDAYTAPIFENTILYQSMEHRYSKNVSWTDTELYRYLLTVEERSQSEALQYLEGIDSIYESIDNDGYRTQQELLELGVESFPEGYLEMVSDEITVDVARDGEFLFVDGRHRLSIAKLLGLESVPVKVLVRHPEWMAKRETEFGHPDCPKQNSRDG